MREGERERERGRDVLKLMLPGCQKPLRLTIGLLFSDCPKFDRKYSYLKSDIIIIK